LSANTTYHYRVKSKDAAGNLATSPDYTFKTAAAPDTTAPVISGVTSSQITAFGATISWTTDEAANSRVEYGTTTTHGNSTALDGAMKTAHSQQLSDLLPNTRYHFRVRSADAAGNESVSADFTFMTAPPPDTTPPSINAVTASEITTSGATISWTTNEAATTQVEYGTTTSYGSKTTLISALTTAHSQALSGLTAGTTYHYRVLSLDGSGNAAVSGDFTFKTLEDKTAPVISNVSTSNANDAGVTITWTTDEPADSEVEYGTSEAYGSSTPVNGALTTAHSVTLSGLSAGKTYHFRVKSRDAAGNAAVSTDYTFNTSDGIGPVITGVSTSNLTVDSITISWMTNEPADTQIEYGAVPKIVKTDSGKQSDKGSKRPTLRNFWQRLLEQLQEKIDRSHPPVYNRSTEVNPSMALTHSQTLTGLSHDTTYHFRVKSRDAAGNLTISQDFVFKTAEKGSAPVIANVSITDLTDRSATISWTTDKPADSQLEYRGKNVEPAKSALGGLVTEHSLTLNNLQKSTLYTFILKAADSDGNEGVSSEFTFTTAETGTASVALPRFTGASIRTVQGTASDVMLGMSLANLSSSAEAVALTAIDSSGNPISGTDIVNPKTENLNSGAQSSIIDRTAFGPGFANSPAEGWIKLESTSSDVDGFFLTFDGSLGFMDGAGLGSAPLKHFAFTGIEPAGTRVSISNPNPEAATVTFSLVKADGTIRGSRSQTIAAEGSLAAGLSDLFGGITPDATDYLSATSTQGVQPFALLQKGEGDVAILAGQDVTAGRTVLYSPQYIVDELWSTSLSVVNLDSRPGMVMFRYIGDDGVQIGETRAAAIPAYGKFQIDDPSFFTELEAGMTVNGYLEIVSDGIRISGSTTFGDRNGTTFATAMPLAQRLGTSALFSHVASSDLYFTQLSVVNPNHGDANVTIELHGADGTLVDSRTIVVPAGERSSGLLTQYFPSLEGSNQSSGYMRVISDIPVTSFSLVGTNDLSVLSAIPPQ
ncbi:MAG: hypothetical protein GXX84_05870, partial [Acidobacteria bacterium]|nr:hypothetical protein [Acidobacteriota bacterium]